MKYYIYILTYPGCTVQQYILRTDNLEKVPNTAACRAGIASAACGPGFFDAAMPADPGDRSVPLIRREFADRRSSGGKHSSNGGSQALQSEDWRGKPLQEGLHSSGRALAAELADVSTLAGDLMLKHVSRQAGAWLEAAAEPAQQVRCMLVSCATSSLPQ